MNKILSLLVIGGFLAVGGRSGLASSVTTGVPIGSEWEIPLETGGRGGAGGEPFRLMSYNVRVDHEQDADTENRWSERSGRVFHVVTKYASDLYTFQEPNESQVADLKSLLGDEYEWVHYRASERAYQSPAEFESEQHRETQAIAFRRTRFELRDAGRFWLAPNPDREPEAAVWDASPFARIAVYAKLYDRTSDTLFTVITAHFDHQGIEARVRSVDLMVAYGLEISEGTPFILTGDFNTFEDVNGKSEIYDAFLGYSDSITDVREVTAKVYGPVSSWVGWYYNPFNQDRLAELRPGIPCRWDHIFLSKGGFDVFQTGVIDDRFMIECDGVAKEVYPSDHRPIVSDLVVRMDVSKRFAGATNR